MFIFICCSNIKEFLSSRTRLSKITRKWHTGNQMVTRPMRNVQGQTPTPNTLNVIQLPADHFTCAHLRYLLNYKSTYSLTHSHAFVFGSVEKLATVLMELKIVAYVSRLLMIQIILYFLLILITLSSAGWFCRVYLSQR